jgi:hypothetical protein
VSRILIKRERTENASEPWRPPGTENIDWKLIWLNPRIAAIVDVDDYEWLKKYHWRLKRSCSCFYAARKVVEKGKTYWIKMHREIVTTPPNMECHHINHHTLDNRKKNLKNLTPDEHASLHMGF